MGPDTISPLGLTTDQANQLTPYQTALMLAQEWGCPVFPTDQSKRPHSVIGKWPQGQGGLRRATVDADQLAHWNRHAPNCSWALHLERCGPGGWLVLDYEGEAKGHSVLAAITATKEAHGPNALPETLLWATPSGGLHAAYRLQPGRAGLTRIPDANGVPIEGCEIRRPGMYCLVPTSPGRRWITFMRPVTAVGWMFTAKIERTIAPPLSPQYRDGENGTSYGARALNDEMARVLAAPVGERNATLNRAAFSLAQLCARGHLAESIVRTELAAAGAAIGLDPDEVRKTVDSGVSAGLAQPRGPEPTTRCTQTAESPAPAKTHRAHGLDTSLRTSLFGRLS